MTFSHSASWWFLATQVSCVNLITQDFSASFCSLEFPGEFLLTRDLMEKHLSRTKPFLFFSYSIFLAAPFAVFLFVGISARRQNLLRSSLLKVHTYKLIYEARCATRQLICHHGTVVPNSIWWLGGLALHRVSFYP